MIRSSMLLRCLLLVAAWQGPIPWCHCHDTPADTAAAIPSWLGQHLQHSHAGAANRPEVPLGWHMHVAFPNAPQPDPTQPTAHDWHVRSAAPSINSGSTIVASVAMLAFVGPAAESPRLDRAEPGQPRSHFFEGFAPSLAMPLRFCIARC